MINEKFKNQKTKKSVDADKTVKLASNDKANNSKGKEKKYIKAKPQAKETVESEVKKFVKNSREDKTAIRS